MQRIQPDADPNSDRLLTETEASDLLSLSKRTLQSWRANRRGPRFVRVGRAVRYRFGDLLDWIADNTEALETAPRP